MKTFDEMRAEIGEFLAKSPESKKLWDLMTGLRGPDYPSERGDQHPELQSRAYQGRRSRKRTTVEVLRYHAFSGIVGGSARYRSDLDHVEVPPEHERDHFDRHVVKTATVLGLEVKVRESKRDGVRVEEKVEGALLEEPGDYPYLGTSMSFKEAAEKFEHGHWVKAYGDANNSAKTHWSKPSNPSTFESMWYGEKEKA